MMVVSLSFPHKIFFHLKNDLVQDSMATSLEEVVMTMTLPPLVVPQGNIMSLEFIQEVQDLQVHTALGMEVLDCQEQDLSDLDWEQLLPTLNQLFKLHPNESKELSLCPTVTVNCPTFNSF